MAEVHHRRSASQRKSSGAMANPFKEVDRIVGTPNLVIYNASARPKKGSIVELDPLETQKVINITCFGAFLVAREAAKRMIPKKREHIFYWSYGRC